MSGSVCRSSPPAAWRTWTHIYFSNWPLRQWLLPLSLYTWDKYEWMNFSAVAKYCSKHIFFLSLPGKKVQDIKDIVWKGFIVSSAIHMNGRQLSLLVPCFQNFIKAKKREVWWSLLHRGSWLYHCTSSQTLRDQIISRLNHHSFSTVISFFRLEIFHWKPIKNRWWTEN